MVKFHYTNMLGETVMGPKEILLIIRQEKINAL